jgi:hypothetical protein
MKGLRPALWSLSLFVAGCSGAVRDRGDASASLDAPSAHAGQQDAGSEGGDGEPITRPGRKLAQIRALTADPFSNLLITEHDHGYVRIVRRKPHGP